jgi:aminoglycoside 3-N-acetyltransferase
MEDFLRQLSQKGVERGKIVLVHSSLRLVGDIEGGGEALLDALIEHCTAEGGLLCIPTHTWGFLRREIALDMTAPESCLGALSSIALADSRGIRSENPTHSMVVFGNRERAIKFVENELFVSSGTAPESCYGKIYREGGYILLIGVSHARNTYLHCVEEMLGMPNRITEEPREVKIKLASGEILTRRMKGHHTDFTNDISLRFPKYETAFRYHGAITDGFIGNAPTQACDAIIMKEVMERIFLNSGDQDPLRDERTISPLLYR